MTDRFKFRAYVKDYIFYDNNGNDIEKSFYLYDIAVYSNTNGFGIDTDLLEHQLSEQGFSEREIENVLQDVDNNEGWCYFDCYCDIEQCTGLKDKNGKLIYEGDILKHKYTPIPAIVCFKDGSFDCDLSRGDNVDLLDKSIEIIGNIHENKELLNKER